MVRTEQAKALQATATSLQQERRQQQGRRAGFDRRGKSQRETELAAACARAGARFVGVQHGVPELGIEPLVLFNDNYGSTLALPVSKFSTNAVHKHMAAAQRHWAARTADFRSLEMALLLSVVNQELTALKHCVRPLRHENGQQQPKEEKQWKRM